MTTRDRLHEKLRDLPEEGLREVLAFVDSLTGASDSQDSRGTAERVLPLAGSMSFEEGELEEILADVQLSRELELDR